MKLTPGDHVYYDCGVYTHHAIYVGAYDFIQFNGKKNGEKSDISKVGLKTFLGGDFSKELWTRTYQSGYKPSEVIKRAKSKLSERGYHLIFNNCEHFASWCHTDKWYSDQVGILTSMATGGGATAALGIGAVSVLPSAFLVAMPLGLVLVGAVAVGGCLGLTAVVGGLVTEFATHGDTYTGVNCKKLGKASNIKYA